MGTRRALTYKQKAEIISRLENGEKNSGLCKEYKISHSTISMMWKNRDKILKCFDTKSSNIKKNRKPMHQDIENALLGWIKANKNYKIRLSGPLLQEKANHFARLFGKIDFECTVSWINRFRQRHDIAVGKVRRKSVSHSDCDNKLKIDFPKLIEDHTDNQIADESDSNPVQKVFLVDEPGQPFKFEIISEESLHNIEDISQDGDDMLDNTEDIGSIDQSHDSTLSGNIADSSQQNISIQIAEVKTPVLNVKPISIEEINHDSTNTDKNEGTVSQQNVKKQTIKDTDSQQNVNKQVKPQPMEVKTTNFNPTKTNVKSKLTKLREAQLELVQLKLETARKEQKFMEAEHKMKMRHLDNEERRKQEIHNLVKRKIMLNNIMEL